MIRKLTKPFRFFYTFTRKKVRNGKIVTDRLIVEVTGTGYYRPDVPTNEDGRYDCDINTIRHGYNDVKELLEFLDAMDDLEEAALREVSVLFTPQTSEV